MMEGTGRYFAPGSGVQRRLDGARGWWPRGGEDGSEEQECQSDGPSERSDIDRRDVAGR